MCIWELSKIIGKILKILVLLNIQGEDDFFERAAMLLNPKPVSIPEITSICSSIKECSLEGETLKLYIQGKSLEVFSLLYNYIYKEKPKLNVYLSSKDKTILNSIKSYIETNFMNSFTIFELTKKFAINQQKLVTSTHCWNSKICRLLWWRLLTKSF